jgi:hypothetical protein
LKDRRGPLDRRVIRAPKVHLGRAVISAPRDQLGRRAVPESQDLKDPQDPRGLQAPLGRPVPSGQLDRKGDKGARLDLTWRNSAAARPPPATCGPASTACSLDPVGDEHPAVLSYLQAVPHSESLYATKWSSLRSKLGHHRSVHGIR